MEVQAGCHIGLAPTRPVQARIIERPGGSHIGEPSPWHEGSWENSLTAILHHRDGLALPDLGGISHQTIAGYVSTGSAGGTVKWSIHDAIARLRVIDGAGRVTELTPDGDDPDWFRAAGIGLGLCGVISTITFRCIPTFDIVGRETVSATRRSNDLDFYGDRPASGLPSARAVPDRHRLRASHVVAAAAFRSPRGVAGATRGVRAAAPAPPLPRNRALSRRLADGGLDRLHRAGQSGSAGARDRARESAAPRKDRGGLERRGPVAATTLFTATSIRRTATGRKGDRRSPIVLGAAWLLVVQLLVTAGDSLLANALKLRCCAAWSSGWPRCVPEHIDTLLAPFVSTGKDGAPVTQEFCDRGFMGLPLDNQMDDLLMPTWFTELWVPFTPGDGRLQETIARLRRCFDADGTAQGAYAATGAFAFELYVAKADHTFFLSPATGSHAFRVDVFWFGNNQANPVTDFYPRFWKALEPLGYRLHWGKFLPPPDAARPDRLTARYPNWERWKAVRARVDPSGLFLTRYWREHLGLPVAASSRRILQARVREHRRSRPVADSRPDSRSA